MTVCTRSSSGIERKRRDAATTAAIFAWRPLEKKGVPKMKPDYKNWIPKGMLFSLIAGTMLSLALLLAFGIFGIGVGGKLRVVLGKALAE